MERINALQTLDDTGKYDSFIAWWSQEIARIKQQILNQKPGSSEGSSNENENPGGEGGSTTAPSTEGSSDNSEGGSTEGGGTNENDNENSGGGSDSGGGVPDVNAGFDMG